MEDKTAYLEERKEAWLEAQLRNSTNENEQKDLTTECEKLFSLASRGPCAATTIG